MGGAAQAVVTSERVSAALFIAVAVALALFALFEVERAVVTPDVLRPLRVALAALSLSFALGLAYEATAVLSHRLRTVSQLADDAFSQHQAWWVALFGVLMFAGGALTLHFTRVAQPSSGLVRMQALLDAIAHPALLAALFSAGIVAAAILVAVLTQRLQRPTGDPGFSWWVVYLGGALYGAGALTAFLTDWKP